MNPRFISLHYTALCENNCKGCYLISQRKNSNEIENWFDLPKVAKSIGVEKIAVAINKININSAKNFLQKFLEECNLNSIFLDITTVLEMGIVIVDRMNLKGVDTLSISIDSEKIKSKEQFELACHLVKYAREKGVNKVNANFLIYSQDEDFSILKKILIFFDSVHIIFQKPFPYTKDEYYNIIEKLYENNVFEDDRYIIDPCILFRLGLIDKCHGCEYMIDINPYGSVARCVYNHSKPLGIIKEMVELSALVGTYCNVPTISKCEHLEFGQDNEINKSRRKEFITHEQ